MHCVVASERVFVVGYDGYIEPSFLSAVIGVHDVGVFVIVGEVSVLFSAYVRVSCFLYLGNFAAGYARGYTPSEWCSV